MSTAVRSARPAVVSCLLLSAAAVSGCVAGSGVPAKETRSIGSYSAIEAVDAIDIRLSTELDPGTLEVRCDDNLIDSIRTELDGHTLVVRTPNGMGIVPRTTCEVRTGRFGITSIRTTGSGDVSGTGPFFALSELHSTGSGNIRLHLRALDPVDEDGAGDGDGDGGFVSDGDAEDLDGTITEDGLVQGIPDHADWLSVRTSGSGDVVITGIDAREVELATTGSGDARLAGAAHALDARSSGSGDINARALDAERAVLTTSGSGDLRATAHTKATAHSSGSGDITIWGNPDRRERSSSGSGDIRFR